MFSFLTWRRAVHQTSDRLIALVVDGLPVVDQHLLNGDHLKRRSARTVREVADAASDFGVSHEAPTRESAPCRGHRDGRPVALLLSSVTEWVAANLFLVCGVLARQLRLRAQGDTGGLPPRPSSRRVHGDGAFLKESCDDCR